MSVSSTSGNTGPNAIDAQPEGPDPVPGMLFGFWYRALEGRTVRRGKLVKARVLDTALVVGRDSGGQVFALLDACPHRGMPLSRGWFDGESVQCSFHGWKFYARTGQCRLLPACTASQRLKLGEIRAGHVRCEERDGYIWVYMAEAEPRRRLLRQAAPSSLDTEPPALEVFSEKYRHFDLSGILPTSADLVLSLLVDAAHGPFVHRTWWVLARVLFGQFVEETVTTYEPTPTGFREKAVSQVPDRWSQQLAGAETTTVEAEFHLPHVRTARIRFGRFWLTSLITVTPVTPTSCRFDQRVAWRALYWMPFAASIMKFIFWLFFVQDRRAMAWQAEGVSRIPRLMFVDDFDRPAKWYYDIKRAFLASRRDGTEFRHPMQGAVTLRWRNASLRDR